MEIVIRFKKGKKHVFYVIDLTDLSMKAKPRYESQFKRLLRAIEECEEETATSLVSLNTIQFLDDCYQLADRDGESL